MNPPLPCMIAFKAAATHPDHYPIEVAWSNPRGDIETHLIHPLGNWQHGGDHTQWHHALPPGQLSILGETPHHVATYMNGCLQGEALYCDNDHHDHLWLKRVFEAAGIEPRFTLVYLDTLLRETYPLIFDTPAQATSINRIDIITAHAAEYVNTMPRHRAANHVRFLVTLYLLVIEEDSRLKKTAETLQCLTSVLEEYDSVFRALADED